MSQSDAYSGQGTEPTQERAKRQGRFDGLVLSLLIVACVVLAVQVTRLRGRLHAVTVVRDSAAVLVGRGEVEHAVLLDALNELQWNDSFLVAEHAGSGTPVVLERPRDGIYTYIRTDCAACATALPSLTEIARAGDDRVTLIALDSSRTAVEQYVLDHALSVPVFVGARGRLLRNVSAPATPTTVLIRSGQVRDVIVGGLDIDKVQELMRRISSIPDGS